MYVLFCATSRSRSRLCTAMHISPIILDSQPTLLCYHRSEWTTRRHPAPVCDMRCATCSITFHPSFFCLCVYDRHITYKVLALILQYVYKVDIFVTIILPIYCFIILAPNFNIPGDLEGEDVVVIGEGEMLHHSTSLNIF